MVTVGGVAAVDARQTTLPKEWRALPAYLMPPGATMNLEQRRRGDADPAPDRLTMRRQLWLDFDGAGYTVRDQLGGRMEGSARLEMGTGQDLGRVVVGDADQPITQRAAGGPAGFEVRQVNLDAVAEGRIEGARRNPPVVGWAHDFQSVEATLALPPGWSLFHGSGADQIGGTWLRGLSLLDLFLVLVVALAAGRLFGHRHGVLALLTMLLLVQEIGAPTWIWLGVLVAEALVQALPAGQLRKVAKVFRFVAAVGPAAGRVPVRARSSRAPRFTPGWRRRADGMRASKEIRLACGAMNLKTSGHVSRRRGEEARSRRKRAGSLQALSSKEEGVMTTAPAQDSGRGRGRGQRLGRGQRGRRSGRRGGR